MRLVPDSLTCSCTFERQYVAVILVTGDAPDGSLLVDILEAGIPEA
jgi:hypothetical protein